MHSVEKITKDYYIRCELCRGTGKEGGVKEADSCKQCNGQGIVLVNREVTEVER